MAQHGRHAQHGQQSQYSQNDHYGQRSQYGQTNQYGQANQYGAYNQYGTYGQGGAGDYSRNAAKYNATNAAKYSAPMSVPQNRGGGKKAAIVIGCILGALLLIAAALWLWYSLTLDSKLAPADADKSKLSEALVSAPIDKPFYMLLLGSDSREGSGTGNGPAESGDQQRSDVIILARIDAPNKTVTLVSVPRDTPYTLDDGTVVKVNEAYNIGGAPMSVKAVSDITGVDIAHYVEVHISELEAIVDTLGGVDVYVDRELVVDDTQKGEEQIIPAGEQTLNGRQAQVFARDRHSYDDSEEGGDNRRQNNVRTLLEAIIDKVLDRPVYELPGTILDLAQYVTSDMKTSDIVALGLAFAGNDVTMYSCTGPSDGDIIESYGGLWFCYPNPEGWAALMAEVDSGQEPGEIDYEATQVIVS